MFPRYTAPKGSRHTPCAVGYGTRSVPAAFLALLLGGMWSTMAAAQVQAVPATETVLPAYPADADYVVLDPPTGEVLGLSNAPGDGDWTSQWLPDGLMYPAYLAGRRESRFASEWVYEHNGKWLWEIALGGHVGLFRYGTNDTILPEGWQIDFEGAVFPRLLMQEDLDLAAADFRVGVPITFRQGPWEAKLAYQHLSSHLGDEFMVHHAGAHRINYVRDAVAVGLALRPMTSLRLYSEVGWAFHNEGGAKPWELQFGVDCSTPEPTSADGSPFFAINGRLHQEVHFGGGLTVQAGWQWRSLTGRLLRLGAEYFNGKSDQGEFFREHEELVGVGIWYDY